MFFPTLRAPFVALGAYAAGVLAVPAVSDTTHDLSAAYDFARSGAGDCSIEPLNLFTLVDTGGTPKDFYANIEDIANTKLPRDLAASRPLHEPIFRSCSPLQKKSLLRAVESSRRYIAMAIDYLQAPGPKPAYRRWFGVHDAARASTVERIFTNFRSNDLSDFTFACDCPEPINHAWVDEEPQIIHLCNGLWDLPVDGVDESQAIVIIHVASLMEETGPLGFFAEGREASTALARNNPARAVQNIDSYLEFIVTVLNLSRRTE